MPKSQLLNIIMISFSLRSQTRMVRHCGLGLVWRWKDLGSIQSLKGPDCPFVHVAISRASSLIQQGDNTKTVVGGGGSMGRSANGTHHSAYGINLRDVEHGLAGCLEEPSLVFCLKEEDVENKVVKYSVA